MQYDPWRHIATDYPEWVVREWTFPDGHRWGLTEHPTRTVWIDKRLDLASERCTLAHELVHVERGPFPEHLREKEEAICDDIAARRLMPLIVLAEAMAWARDQAELRRVLEVDPPMLDARMSGLTPWERELLDRHMRDHRLRYPKR